MRWPWARASIEKGSCGQLKGRTELEALGLDPWASRRRRELLAILDQLDPSLAELDRAVAREAGQHAAARSLMEQPGVGPRSQP